MLFPVADRTASPDSAPACSRKRLVPEVAPRGARTTAEARPGHMVQLDALRALAVGAVLVQHTLPWAAVTLNPGEAGVRLFFVLSGFLITGILLRARAEAEAAGQGAGSVLLSFYARRFLRIFPLYYALLLISAAADGAGTRGPFVWNMAYLANWRIALLGRW